ncbi:hypothetical protein AB4428_17310 [Vibrio lentus]
MKVKIFLAVLLGMACNTATAEAEKTSNDEVQRIILVRHAEKPDDGLGNLTCQLKPVSCMAMVNAIATFVLW